MPQLLCRVVSFRGEATAQGLYDLVLSVDSHANNSTSNARLVKRVQSGKRCFEIVDFDALVERVASGDEVLIQDGNGSNVKVLRLIIHDGEVRYVNEDIRPIGDDGAFGVKHQWWT